MTNETIVEKINGRIQAQISKWGNQIVRDPQHWSPDKNRYIFYISSEVFIKKDMNE